MSGSMLGLHNIAVNTTTLADGHTIAAYLTSAAGVLITHTTNGAKQAADVFQAGAFAEDSAHTTGDFGQFVMGVRNDAGTAFGADGDYVPLSITSTGALRVDATVNFAGDYAEDSAHVSGDVGLFTLLVRQDALASSTSADGDYGAFKSNAAGELYVTDSSANTTLTAILADTATIDTNIAAILADTATIDSNTASILAEIQALSYAEDSAHVSGDMGTMPLAVRNDTPGSLVSANGDYAPLQVDATGNLRVTFTATSQYAEDSAAVSGDMGTFALAVRRDTTGANTSANGDYSELQTWSNGELKTVDISNLSILQQQVSVTSTAAAVPAAALANRKSLMLQNTSSAKIWIGSATVTTSGATSGIELPANSFMEMEVGPAVSVFAVKSGAGSLNLNLLEMN